MRIAGAALLIAIAGIVAAACSSGGDDDKTPTATVRAGETVVATSTPAETAAGTPVAGAYGGERVLDALDFGVTTGMYPIPGDDGFAYLLEKTGRVRRVSFTEGGPAPEIVLNLATKLPSQLGAEEGVLGLAFAPDFATSRRIYVNYTQGNPRRDTVSRFVMPASGEADLATEEVLIEIEDFAPNHNGGGMQFGPDGMLYIGFGDGGGGGDPQGNGQKTDVLLAKLLRIDVSGATGYTSPPDNPFANGGGRPEVWAYGLRNPWRFDFDDETGALWLADVGQNVWEEIDVIEKGGNYGWNIMEGPDCFQPRTGCDTTGLITPVASYSHADGGCSATGGFIYRGTELPELRGWFVYGDYCSEKMWAIDTRSPGEPVELGESGAPITAFAEDEAGELYMLTSGPPSKLVRE